MALRVVALGLAALFAPRPGFAGVPTPVHDASVMTDAGDYAPGNVAAIAGSGFEPGETVTLRVLRGREIAGERPTHPAVGAWTATANGVGDFDASWATPSTVDGTGTTLRLVATGTRSGRQAVAVFKDGNVTLSGATTTGKATGFRYRLNAMPSPPRTHAMPSGVAKTLAIANDRPATLEAGSRDAFGRPFEGWSRGVGIGKAVDVGTPDPTRPWIITLSGIGPGIHPFTAIYKVRPSMKETLTINAPNVGHGMDGEVTVTIAAAGETPTGDVTLSIDGGRGISQPLVGGVAAYSISRPAPGVHALRATFSPAGTFVAQSGTGSLVVR